MCKCDPRVKTPYCYKTDECRPDNQIKADLLAMPCIYVFVNKGLEMSKGKAIAQGVHAAMMSTIDAHDSLRSFWKNSMHRTVLVMEARDTEHIHNIQQYLKERKFKTYLIIDEGVNEIDPHVPTALATSILNKEEADVKAALSTFSLFREKVRVITEINI